MRKRGKLNVLSQCQTGREEDVEEDAVEDNDSICIITMVLDL